MTAPVWGDLLAASVTAVVFFAEYLSLGAGLGLKLPGYGQTAQALGTLLVLVTLALACCGAVLHRTSVLAGPRAASLALFAASVQYAAALAPEMPRQAGLVSGCLILLIASSTILAGMHRGVRSLIEKAPAALLVGFMYATAVSIVSGVAGKQLAPCLVQHGMASWMLFGSSTVLGIAWAPLVRRLGGAKMVLVSQLGVPVGAGVAWAGYATVRVSGGWGEGCGTLGRVGFDIDQAIERWLPSAADWLAMPSGAITACILCGFGLGVILLIENLTTLKASDIPRDRWRGLLAVNAISNLAAAPLGLTCSSFSTSRSTALQALGGKSGWAVFAHGVIVLALAAFAMPGMSQLPRLAVGVALVLVAAQMISADGCRIWSDAYGGTSTVGARRAIWIFWAVVAIAAFCDQPLLGLAAGLAVLGLSGWISAKLGRVPSQADVQ